MAKFTYTEVPEHPLERFVGTAIWQQKLDGDKHHHVTNQMFCQLLPLPYITALFFDVAAGENLSLCTKLSEVTGCPFPRLYFDAPYARPRFKERISDCNAIEQIELQSLVVPMCFRVPGILFNRK